MGFWVAYYLDAEAPVGYSDPVSVTVEHVLSSSDTLATPPAYQDGAVAQGAGVWLFAAPVLTINHSLTITETFDAGAADDLEGAVLDGLSLNTHGVYRLEELTFGPSPKRPEMIGNADSDGEALLRDPKHSNRTLTAKVHILAEARDEANEAIDSIVQKLEECEVTDGGLPFVWTPVSGTRAFTAYVLSGEITDLPITVESGYFVNKPIVTVQMTCRPKLYGATQSFGPVTASTPLVELELPDVGGQLHGEGVLTVTDAAGQVRRTVEWGLEQRHYDPLTPSDLMLTSDQFTLAGYAGASTTRTGSYGANVARGTLIDAWSAIAAVTGDHVGIFRAILRCYVTSVDEQVRVSWRSGDSAYVQNPAVTPPATGWVELDLGLISIPEASLGAQTWTARVEGRSTTIGDTLDADLLELIPAGEGFGRARADVPAGAASALTGYDDFSDSSGALNGGTADLGGAWATSGDATDLAYEGGNLIRSTTTADSGSGRIAVLGSSAPSNVAASAEVEITAFDDPQAELGLILRYVDASNFLSCYLAADFHQTTSDDPTLTLVIAQRVAGTTTVLASKAVTILTQNAFGFSWAKLEATAYDTGLVRLNLVEDDRVRFTVEAFSTAVAASGALDDGKSGVRDKAVAFGSPVLGPVLTRRIRAFTVGIPAPEPIVVHANQSIVFRHDGRPLRENAAGTAYGAPPLYRGAPFLVPAAGDQDRTSRVVVAVRRADTQASAADNVTDSTTVGVTVTSCYLWPA